TSNNFVKQELEVNKISIETTNIDKSSSLELIEIEMTPDETQPKAKAKAITKNVIKKLEEQTRLELEDIYIYKSRNKKANIYENKNEK
ncbi:10040_t:CDS:2, partial [Scutellospora calospora]